MENYWKLPTKNTWRCICWGFDSCNQFGTRCVGWIGSLLGFMAYWDLERCYLGSLIQQESWGWEVCFWGDVNRLDGLEYFFCAWVEVVSLSEMLCKRHFFLVKLPKRVCLFFVGDFFVPERLWEDDFRILAFGIFFFKMEGEKKTSIDWSRHSHNCAPVISEAIAISRRVGKILENRIEWKKPVGCLRLGNHLLPSDMKSNVGFINKPLEGILLFTMEGNKGVSFSMLNWWHGEKIKASCVFCFNPCFFGKIDKPTNFWWESRFVTLLGTNISHLGENENHLQEYLLRGYVSSQEG